jgi:hypothetical protein
MRHTSGEEAVMEKSASTSYIARAEELLSVMSNEEAKPAKTRFYKSLLQNILVACCGILAIAALGKGFLYLDNGISTVESAVGSAVKDLNTLKVQVTAADAREQLATVTAEVKNLRTTSTQLLAEVEQIRDTFDALKAKRNNVASAQRKR